MIPKIPPGKKSVGQLKALSEELLKKLANVGYRWYSRRCFWSYFAGVLGKQKEFFGEFKNKFPSELSEGISGGTPKVFFREASGRVNKFSEILKNKLQDEIGKK